MVKKMTFRKLFTIISVVLLSCATLFSGAALGFVPDDYASVSQGELVTKEAKYQGKKIWFEGSFLFYGSDFCYQIRKTKINTKDFMCFALGPVGQVRLYLKKDHEQIPNLMKLKKGQNVKAYGTFDYLGGDYKFMVVDQIEITQ